MGVFVQPENADWEGEAHADYGLVRGKTPVGTVGRQYPQRDQEQQPRQHKAKRFRQHRPYPPSCHRAETIERGGRVPALPHISLFVAEVVRLTLRANSIDRAQPRSPGTARSAGASLCVRLSVFRNGTLHIITRIESLCCRSHAFAYLRIRHGYAARALARLEADRC